jgi:hypothetical protein
METDSAFHRMSQLDGTLLHVSGSARPNQLGVAYNALVVEAILAIVASALGSR